MLKSGEFFHQLGRDVGTGLGLESGDGVEKLVQNYRMLTDPVADPARYCDELNQLLQRQRVFSQQGQIGGPATNGLDHRDKSDQGNLGTGRGTTYP